MKNFIDENPVWLRERGTAADNIGDYEKAALFYALAEAIELIEEQADKIAELEKDLEKCADYSGYREFFYDCFARMDGIYPCPDVTSDYDRSIIFDAIEKGEAYNA